MSLASFFFLTDPGSSFLDTIKQMIVNQNFRSGDLIEIKGVYLGFVRPAAQETQTQEALVLCSPRLQNGGG